MTKPCKGIAYLSSGSGRPEVHIEKQETSIGRILTNSIVLDDPTVSKTHAVINYLPSRDKFYISDLDTVNGTFVNGMRLNQRTKLSHNDIIQFGRHEILFRFKLTAETHDNSKKETGKINLKNYFGELYQNQPKKDIQESKLHSINSIQDSNVVLQGTFGKQKMSFERPQPSNYDSAKLKFSAINQHKEMEPRSNSISGTKRQQLKQRQLRPLRKKSPDKLILPQNSPLNTDEMRPSANSPRKKTETQAVRGKEHNYLLLQQELKRWKQKQQESDQSKINNLLKKIRQEQLGLQKQLKKEEQLKKEKRKIEENKRVMAEKKKRQSFLEIQANREKELQRQKKQRLLIEQLSKEKQLQIQKIAQEQEGKVLKTQQNLKEDFDRQKKDLEQQARALALQYQNIYKETLNTLRTEIRTEERRHDQIRQKIAQLQKETEGVLKQKEIIKSKLPKQKSAFLDVNGKNKACILYASHIQDKIDAIKQSFEASTRNKDKRASKELEESIQNSRKFFYIKNQQCKSLDNEIRGLRASILLTNENAETYLDTILDNHLTITQLKGQYFQYVENQNAIQSTWESALKEYEQTEETVRNLKSQMEANRKQMADDLKDYIKKITEQRNAMLRIMLLSEDKKKAAKYLVEQMETIEFESKELMIENEDMHKAIVKIISESEGIKEESEHMSGLLFNSSNDHHFDNMKAQLNQLFEVLQDKVNPSHNATQVKLSEEVQQLQLSIEEEVRKAKNIQEQAKHYIHCSPVLKVQKSPITYFGSLLLGKERELEEFEQKNKKTQNQIKLIEQQTTVLQKRKLALNATLQKYKKQQMLQAKDYLS